jgi:hypothetical protein
MNDISIDCLTTQNLVSLNSLFPVLEVLRKSLACDKFRLVWIGTDGEQHFSICENFNEPVLKERWAMGALVMEDLTGECWSVGFRRASDSRRRVNQKALDLRQNEIVISFSRGFGRAIDILANPALLVTELYRTTRSNYLIVREARANICGSAVSATRGLVDLYWINVFGPPYVKLFTREKLLQLPAYKTLEMPDGGIYLQLTQLPLDCDDAKWVEQRRQLIEFLGPDCFSPIRTRTHAGGQFSAFNVVGLIKSFLASRRPRGVGRDGRPLRVPEIDWEQLIDGR